MRPGPTIFRTARDGFVTSPHRVGVFRRFKHSMSSGLQFSSPRPVTKTSSQLRAVLASGAVSCLAALDSATEAVELFVVLAATAEAPDKVAPRLPTSGGTPVAVPPKE